MMALLSWVALAASAVVVAFAIVAARRQGLRASPNSGTVLFFSGLLLAVLVLGTLPVRPPWSPGQTLAPGLLLGGAAALFCAFLGRNPRAEVLAPEGASFLAAAARLGAATLGVSLLLVLYPTRILDALGGFGIGAVAVALLFATAGEFQEPSRDSKGAAAEEGAGIAIALAAATYLAALHRGPASPAVGVAVRDWQPLPALLTASAGLLFTVRSLRPPFPGRALGQTVVTVLLPAAAIAGVVAYRLGGTPGLFRLFLLGTGTFALVGWLDRIEDRRGPARRGLIQVDLTLLAPLLALGAGALAFRQLHGYGVALLVLCGLGVLAAAQDGVAAGRPLLRGSLHLLLLLALYRVYTERYQPRGVIEPHHFYVFAALIFAAFLPMLLAGAVSGGAAAEPPANAGSGSAVGVSERKWEVLLALGKRAALGVLAAFAPLAVWVLVGPGPQAAFLLGLAFGAAFLPAIARAGSGLAPVVRLLGLAMALSAIQLTHLLAPLALRTRWERAAILAVPVAGILAWAFAGSVRELLERRRTRESGE